MNKSDKEKSPLEYIRSFNSFETSLLYFINQQEKPTMMAEAKWRDAWRDDFY